MCFRELVHKNCLFCLHYYSHFTTQGTMKKRTTFNNIFETDTTTPIDNLVLKARTRRCQNRTNLDRYTEWLNSAAGLKTLEFMLKLAQEVELRASQISIEQMD